MDQFAGRWSQVRGAIRRSWGKLTGDDLEVIARSKDRLAGALRVRYGIAKEGAEDQIEWLTTVPPPYPGLPRRL
jgi:uncharacterized protein YjbJ (UPF0337 family)